MYTYRVSQCEQDVSLGLTLHIADIVVRGAPGRADLVKDFSAKLLCDVGVLGQLVDTVGKGSRRCIAAGDEEVDDLVREDITVYRD